MTGAVPGFFRVVPCDDAAEVRTNGAVEVDLPFLVAKGGDGSAVMLDDLAGRR